LNWTRTGDTTWYTGSPKVSTHSVQLRQTGQIQRTISLAGRTVISVAFKMGAYSLEGSEMVQAQYFDGASWQTIAEILNGNSQEDNQLHQFGVQLPAKVANLVTFALRFRILGSSTRDYGYVDDVIVSGTGIVPSATVKLYKSLSTGLSIVAVTGTSQINTAV
jgi:hypothetical protein